MRRRKLLSILLLLGALSLALGGVGEPLARPSQARAAESEADRAQTTPVPWGVIQGIVYDQDAGTKIVGVLITFEGVNVSHRAEVRSDSAGAYSVRMPYGRYRVLTAHPDYEPMLMQGYFVIAASNSVGNIALARKTTPGERQPTQPGQTSAVSIVVDGAGHVTGPLPIVYYALAELPGKDIYPLGKGAYALYALLDTGSTKVRINSQPPPNRVTGPNWGMSDSEILQLTTVATVNVRLNGLSARSPEGNIPIAAQGSPNGAQAEVSTIAVKPENVDVTLLGAPVVNRVITLIDYTKQIVIPASEGQREVVGPSIVFYRPGAASAPAPDLQLKIAPTASVAGGDGATTGSRYLLRSVTFTSGKNSASDQRQGYTLLLDTGTTLTIINDRIAADLGLLRGTGRGQCYGGSNNRYTIDAVTMSGANGSYTVRSAAVCWQQSAVKSGDAVIGSNLFDQVQLIIDGPQQIIGIKGGHAQGAILPGTDTVDTCAGVEVEGTCWYLGAEDASCEAVCAGHSGYSEATRSFAGSDGTQSNCRRVLSALGVTYPSFYETAQGGIGCFVIRNTKGSYFGYWDAQPTLAAATAATPGRQRACACQR